ncbi:hypothetical protein H1R20_g12053, partial [Candolleomyces eurysporus]
MQFQFSLSLLATVLALLVMGADAQAFTARRKYQTLVKESPYFIELTTTVVWTQQPAATAPPS